MRDVEVLDLINRAVGVAVQRAIRAATAPACLFGTVIALDFTRPGIHEVLLDGDSEQVAAVNVSGFPLAVGSRVAILAAPPHQFWIIGNLGKCVQSDSFFITWNTTSSLTLTNVEFPFPFAATPEMMFSVSGDATSATFGFRTNLITATKFDVKIETVDGSNVSGIMVLQWFAVGPPI